MVTVCLNIVQDEKIAAFAANRFSGEECCISLSVLGEKTDLFFEVHRF